MLELSIVIGIFLMVAGVGLWMATEEKNVLSSLPPRNNNVMNGQTGYQQKSHIHNRKISPALPPRRNVSRSAFSRNSGPHGLTPTEFPCCPLDKQRNLPGKPQYIFWDEINQCYYCSRGHRIKSNGKPF